MANKTSNHILATSTNLLGLCLIVITSLHITDKNESNFLDEIAIRITSYQPGMIKWLFHVTYKKQ